MKTEIEYAVNFLASTICGKLFTLSVEQTETLKVTLTSLLIERFEGHWYPDKSMKGSAYRCININVDDNSIDTVLREAAAQCSLTCENLMHVFNKGVALWIDPNDVCCRIGKGAIFPIYRKIADKSSTMAFTKGKQRPQQRPRSISPPHVMTPQQYQRSRSTTPPGFSSQDAGQLFQSIPTNKQSSLENLHKLWDALPNTTSHNYSMMQQHTPVVTYSSPPVTYSSPPSTSYPRKDTVYSFNQYSSYYKPSTSYWKKTTTQQQQAKPVWQSDDVFNRYHWARNETSSVIRQENDISTYSSYTPSRQAQEVY